MASKGGQGGGRGGNQAPPRQIDPTTKPLFDPGSVGSRPPSRPRRQDTPDQVDAMSASFGESMFIDNSGPKVDLGERGRTKERPTPAKKHSQSPAPSSQPSTSGSRPSSTAPSITASEPTKARRVDTLRQEERSFSAPPSISGQEGRSLSKGRSPSPDIKPDDPPVVGSKVHPTIAKKQKAYANEKKAAEEYEPIAGSSKDKGKARSKGEEDHKTVSRKDTGEVESSTQLEDAQKEALDHLLRVQRKSGLFSSFSAAGIEELIRQRAISQNSYCAAIAQGGTAGVTHYPGISKSIPSWSPYRRPWVNFPNEIQHPVDRHTALIQALQIVAAHDVMIVAKQDRATGERENPKAIQRIEEVNRHKELQRFEESKCRGLQIHSNDDPKKHKGLQNSLLSNFFSKYAAAKLAKDWIVLTHSGVICERRKSREGRLPIHGEGGLIRSLCGQLILQISRKQNDDYYKALLYPYIKDQRTLKKINDSDLPTCYEIFREVLCDVAHHMFENKLRPQIVLVIIDDLHAIEGADAQRVVGFLRTLSDECEVGKLGEFIKFRYMLLHPMKGDLSPYPTERHIFFD